MSQLRIVLLVFVAAAQTQAQSLISTPPITPEERLQYYLKRTYSWQRFSWLAVDTAVDHLLNEPEWGRGPGGYACQYASSFGRRLIGNTVEFGVGLALKEDIGFHASHRTGMVPRMRYAASHAFLTTVAGGKTQPAYARFAGITGAALVAPAWHHETLSASGFALDMAFGSLDQLQNNFLTEFGPDLKHFGRKVWQKTSDGWAVPAAAFRRP